MAYDDNQKKVIAAATELNISVAAYSYFALFFLQKKPDYIPFTVP
jgi:hypothetical protein